MTYQTILFDFDDTLVDTEKSVLTSLQIVLARHGIHKTFAELEFSLGIPGLNAMKQLGVTDPVAVGREWSAEALLHKKSVTIFPGITKLIQQLKQTGHQIGIVTSKNEAEVRDEITIYPFTKQMAIIVSASDTKLHKPKPDPLLYAIQQLNSDAVNTLYIGDTEYDLKAALGAGTGFAVAGWGAHDHGQFKQATYYLQQPQQLLTQLTLN